jgi:hypothetical protein
VLDLQPVAEADLRASREKHLDRGVVRRVASALEDQATARQAVERAAERATDTLRYYNVVDEGRTVGWLAWWQRGDQCEVNDLTLDEPGRAAELLPRLLELARSSGCPMLGVSTAPGESARDHLAGLDGFVRRATHMMLRLDAPIADPGDLQLRTMTQSEFDDYVVASTEQYIGELAAAGMTPEAARQQGETQMAWTRRASPSSQQTSAGLPSARCGCRRRAPSRSSTTSRSARTSVARATARR